MGAPNSRHSISTKNYLNVSAGEYPCGNNLYLVVAPTGARRWLFRFQRHGIKDSMGFGSARDVTFNDAKDMAINARRLLAKGINPKESRDEERRAQGCPLFGPYARAWRETYEKSLKHRASRDKLKRNIDVHCATLHKLRLDEIATDHVIKQVLDPIRHQVENVRDVRQRLELVFDARSLTITARTILRTMTPSCAPAWARRRSAAGFAAITRASRITICRPS